MLPNATGQRKRDKLLQGVTSAANSAAAAAGSATKRAGGAKKSSAAKPREGGSGQQVTHQTKPEEPIVRKRNHAARTPLFSRPRSTLGHSSLLHWREQLGYRVKTAAAQQQVSRVAYRCSREKKRERGRECDMISEMEAQRLLEVSKMCPRVAVEKCTLPSCCPTPKRRWQLFLPTHTHPARVTAGSSVPSHRAGKARWL